MKFKNLEELVDFSLKHAVTNFSIFKEKRFNSRRYSTFHIKYEIFYEDGPHDFEIHIQYGENSATYVHWIYNSLIDEIVESPPNAIFAINQIFYRDNILIHDSPRHAAEKVRSMLYKIEDTFGCEIEKEIWDITGIT